MPEPVLDLSTRNVQRVFPESAPASLDKGNSGQFQGGGHARLVDEESPQQNLTQTEPETEDPNADLRKRLAELSGEANDEANESQVESVSTDGLPQAPQEEAAPVDPEQFQRFGQELQQYFGITPDELKEGIGFVREFRQQQALTQLKSEWGDAFDSTFETVRKRWESLPVDMQGALDNIEGAKLIAAQLQVEQQKSRSVPTFDRSKGVIPRSTQSPYQFTKSEIEGLSNEDYRKNAKLITDAYTRGLVDLTQ